MKVTDLDIVFISFDEPKADEFYENLVEISPRKPLRVHGVEGFDAAHKAAASLAGTERFITVDGDCLVRKDFFERDIRMESDYVYSFSALNSINGLVYGNGGIKIWPKNLLKVGTHEAGSGNDFCWTYRYWQVDEIASDSYPAQTPCHAFRAGFREGVKLSLVRDQRLENWDQARQQMYPPNLSRLLIWMTIGADVEYGEWAMYGARCGFCYVWETQLVVQLTHDRYEKSDLDMIHDYKRFAMEWKHVYSKHASYLTGIPRLKSLEQAEWLKLCYDLDVMEIPAEQSKWFKSVMLHGINIPRQGPMIPNMKPVL